MKNMCEWTDTPKRDVFQEQIAADPEIQELIRVIAQGWPEKKHCPPAVRPYYDERSELIESQGLVFRGKKLVVPRSLPKDTLNQIHSSHIGIGGCICRAREILYWPGMSVEILILSQDAPPARRIDQHRLGKS